MKVKLPVTQYQEVDIKLPLQKEITEHLIKRVCGYSGLYMKGGNLFKTETNGCADSSCWSERFVREATEEDKFIFKLLADISKFNGEGK